MMIGAASSQVLLACGSRMRFLGANNFIFREIAQGINSIVHSQPAVDCFNSLIAVASPRQASDLAASISTYVMRLSQHKLGNYLVQMVLDRAFSGLEGHGEQITAEDTEGAKKMLRTIGNSNSKADSHTESCLRLRAQPLFVSCVCARAAENVVVLSLNKYASNCVERVLQHADEEIMSILTTHIFKQDNLERMIADDYAKCALAHFARLFCALCQPAPYARS